MFAGRPWNLLDIVFVMGSREPNALDMFNLQKTTALSMIEDSKTADTMYAVVQYGETPVYRVHFKETRSDEDTQEAIKALRWSEEGTGLHKGITMAGEILENEGRANARKVIVKFSYSSVKEPESEFIDNATRKAKSDGIKVVDGSINGLVDLKTKSILKFPSGQVVLFKELWETVKEETFRGTVVF